MFELRITNTGDIIGGGHTINISEFLKYSSNKITDIDNYLILDVAALNTTLTGIKSSVTDNTGLINDNSASITTNAADIVTANNDITTNSDSIDTTNSNLADLVIKVGEKTISTSQPTGGVDGDVWYLI